jgi:putative transcriptional regulator
MSTINYEGKILIATPNVTGKLFNKSVIFIHTADDTGASGVMLNVPMDYDMAVMWSKEIDWQYPNSIYQGGPVDRQLGYVIHSADYARDTSVHLNDALSYTGGRAIVDDINRGVGPRQFQLSTGYCQWSPHQLQTEIDHDMWVVTDFDVDYFFQDLDREHGWEFAINVAAENKTNKLLDVIDIA